MIIKISNVPHAYYLLHLASPKDVLSYLGEKMMRASSDVSDEMIYSRKNVE